MRAFKMETQYFVAFHLRQYGAVGPQWWFKRSILRRIFSRPADFAVVGTLTEGITIVCVQPERLFAVHTHGQGRFAEPAHRYEQRRGYGGMSWNFR